MKKVSGVVLLVTVFILVCFAAEQQDLSKRAIYDAVSENRSVGEIKNLVESSLGLQWVNGLGYSSLHMAVYHDHSIEVIRTLLSAPGGGALLTLQNHEGNTPVHEAVYNTHDIEMVCVLLSVPGGSAVLAIQNNLGETPLHRAIENNASIEMVHALLSAPGGLIALAIREDLGETPLHSAVFYGRSIEVVRLLLSSPGGHIALVMQNVDGETPMHEAIYADNSLESIRALLEQAPHAKQALSVRDKNGKTPIDIVLEASNLDRSVLALLFSAYISYPDRARSENQQGRSEVMPAGQENDSALVLHPGEEEPMLAQGEREPEKILELTQALHDRLSSCHSQDDIRDIIHQGALVSAVGDQGMTAVHMAIAHGVDEEVFKGLIEARDAKEALMIVDQIGRTVMHLAIESGVSAAIFHVLVNIAESHLMNIRNAEGKTALYCAFATQKSDAILRMLLNLVDSHAAVCSPKYGKPLLHCAVESRCSDEILAQLMVWMSDEDLRARDEKTRTALHLAVEHDVRVSKLRTLIEGGVDPQARTHQGKTALDFAHERGDIEMRLFLSSVCKSTDEIRDGHSCHEEDEDKKEEDAECPICCEVYNQNRPVTIICERLHEMCGVCAGNKKLLNCPFCRGALVRRTRRSSCQRWLLEDRPPSCW